METPPNIPERPGVSKPTMLAVGIHYSDQPEAGSIEIPYPYLPDFSRWRLPEPRPNGQKYYQKPGTGVHLYLPPTTFNHEVAPMFGLPEHYAVLLEGEFKMLALLELGVFAIGLPGIITYTKNKTTGIRQLLPELQTVLSQDEIEHVYFLGDADTYANYNFMRNVAFLALAIRPIQLWLPRIPLSGPGKGIDDCKEALGDKFETFFTNVIKEATPYG